MLTLKEWIDLLPTANKVVTLNSVNVVTSVMWSESKYKWGTRETILDNEEITALWESWKITHMKSWERIYTALTVEYSPIENTDRYEDITDTTTHTGTDNRTLASTNTKSGSDTLARTGTDTNASTLNTTVTGTDGNVHKINAFNGEDTTTDNTDTGNNTTVTSGGDTMTNTKNLTDTTTYNTTEGESGSDNRTVNLTDTLHHINHTHGNIGVTRNDELIGYEIALREQHYLYHEIVEKFLLEFFF